jgi:hypothetical protein
MLPLAITPPPAIVAQVAATAFGIDQSQPVTVEQSQAFLLAMRAQRVRGSSPTARQRKTSCSRRRASVPRRSRSTNFKSAKRPRRMPRRRIPSSSSRQRSSAKRDSYVCFFVRNFSSHCGSMYDSGYSYALKQHGRRFPSASCSTVRCTRRARVAAFFVPSIQRT